MAKYAAVCNRFPELQLGTEIKFSEGSFETDNEDLWAQLQKSDWWGVHIHPRDAPPAADGSAEPAVAPVAPEPAPEPTAYPGSDEESTGGRVHRGPRGTR